MTLVPKNLVTKPHDPPSRVDVHVPSLRGVLFKGKLYGHG